MSDPVDLLSLDRDVGRAAGASGAWLRALRAAPAEGAELAPLEGALRWTSTRGTWAALHDAAPDGHPMRDPMRRWVLRLCLARIGRATIAAAEELRDAPRVRTETPEATTLSPRDAVRRALAERAEERRRAWLRALDGQVGALASAARARDEALAEIAARLGVADARALLLPCDPEAIARAAEETLAATADLAAARLGGCEDLAGLVSRTLAREVAGVWPAHLVARTLAAPFAGTALLEGVSLDLGPLPRALGAASWARALARFGAAWSRGAAPRSAPFVLAHDPTDARAHRRGALFGALVVDPAFLRHALGLSREAARSAARTLATTLLAAVRLEAARTLVGDARTPLAESSERLAAALGVHVPRGLAHVLPRDERRAPVRLLGALGAVADRAALVASHDEDWFRNPRALAALRGDEGTLADHAVDPASLDGAPRALARALEELAA